MKFDVNILNEFARSYGFHYDLVHGEVLVQDILNEMDRGLKAEDSTLAMIPAYIKPLSGLPAGKPVVALDAGGTNLRAAIVQFNAEGEALTQNETKVPMPGAKGKGIVEPDAFFNEIAGLIAPLLEACPAAAGIGFTFSYPMEITKDSDGILLGLSKEINAPGLIGKAIGAGVIDALKARGIKAPPKITLLNDTAATLLSGVAEIPGKGPCIGFILGTGFNTAYPETEIKKIGFANSSNPQIVVCETGNVKPRYLGYIDDEFDAGTKEPGVYRLEKSTSGAYLGGLCLHVFKHAAEDGLLEFAKKDELLAMKTLETRQLNEWMRGEAESNNVILNLLGKDEIAAGQTIAYLTSLVTERAAIFSAAVVAAMVERIERQSPGKTTDPFAPVRIAVEGTTYMIYKGMRRALDASLHHLLAKNGPRSYVMQPVEQASLFGAAVAALS
ncbi:MAG: hexokinase [Spirochaetaceae bacterium]|jgi:hexokinase|nr:hexokinase [Spirochaetaceae bacterium]